MRRITHSTVKDSVSEPPGRDADGVTEAKNRKTTRSTAKAAAAAAASEPPAPDADGAVQKKNKRAAPKPGKGKAKPAVVKEPEREDTDTDTVANLKVKRKGKNKHKNDKGAPAPTPDPSASRPPSPSPSKNPDQVTDGAINAPASVPDPPASPASPRRQSPPTRETTPKTPLKIKRDPDAIGSNFGPFPLIDLAQEGADSPSSQEGEAQRDGLPDYLYSPAPEPRPDPLEEEYDDDQQMEIEVEPVATEEVDNAEDQQVKPDVEEVDDAKDQQVEPDAEEVDDAKDQQDVDVNPRSLRPGWHQSAAYRSLHENPAIAKKIAGTQAAAATARTTGGPELPRINFAQRSTPNRPPRHFRLRPVPLEPVQEERPGPQRHAAAPADAEDHDDLAADSDSDGSNFSESEKLQRKADATHNRRAQQVPWLPVIESQEEQDATDLVDYLADMENDKAAEGSGGKKGKGKGKGKGKDRDVGGGTLTERPGSGGGEDDDDDDDPEQPTTPWDLTPGPLSKADLEVALAGRRVYHKLIEDLARRTGKKVSAVFRAVGDLTKSARNTNGWNAFQAKFRAENRKDPSESKADYRERMVNAYHELFVSLSKEERNNAEARRACLEETFEWYENTTSQAVDGRKSEGHGRALLSKQAQPFISLSTVVSNNTDIDIWGFGHDSFSDESLIWGGSPTFLQVYQNPAFQGAIKVVLNEMKSMFTTARMLNRNAATMEGALAVPAVVVDFNRKPTEKNGRDAKRRQLGQLFLNDIYHALMARGERLEDLKVKIKKMSWKWSDLACTYKLRIENWPVDLKDAFPGPGFSLGQIKGKEAVRALDGMVDDMKTRYESAEEVPGGGVRIVSWTEEEMDLDDLDDIANIPIIVCCDESELMLAQTSKKLLRNHTKNKRDSGGDHSEEEEDEEEDEGEQEEDEEATDMATQKKRRGADKGKKRHQSATDDEPPAKRVRLSTSPTPPPASRPPPHARSKNNSHASGSKPTATSTSAATRPSTSKPATARVKVKPTASRSDSGASPPLLKFRYKYKGVMSDIFHATGMRHVQKPTLVNRHTLMWTLGSWSEVPEGYEPIVPPGMEAYCEVLQMNIRLLA